MSLLMDALRRAEGEGKTAVDEPKDAPSELVQRPASNSPLQLEPIEENAALGVADSTDPPVAVNPTNTAPPQPGEAADTAPASVEKPTSAKRTGLHPGVVFIGSGILCTGALLTGYFFWQLDASRQYDLAPAATLIDSADFSDHTSGEERAAPPVLSEPLAPADESVPTPAPTAEQLPVAVADSVPATALTPARAEPPPEPSALPKIQIHRGRAGAAVPAALNQAYQAYRNGDYARAEPLYRQVLRSFPGNRDALLGLAAIAIHAGDRAGAQRHYRRLLEANPHDRTALLGLQGLSAQPQSLEQGSRLKYWLQTERDDPQLHFALGNQYAASGQWREAQESYFQAHQLAPENADYAFNLAISLDRLGKQAQALTFYTKALALAKDGPALLPSAQAESRVRQLQRLLGQTK